MDNLNLEKAIQHLYLMAGVSNPTKRDRNIALEAIMEGNIDSYKEEPKTIKEYLDKVMFEVRAIHYFNLKRLNPLNYTEETVPTTDHKKTRGLIPQIKIP